MRLAQPDSLLIIKRIPNPDFGFRVVSINVLPVIMTLISLASAAVYSKGFGVKDKIWLFVIPFIFLFLLYNLPSCLVLYWTCNNVFSFARNIIKKTDIPKQAAESLASVFRKKPASETKQENYTGMLVLSLAALFLLGGLVIPLLLIQTDVMGFAIVEDFKNPVRFIINTMLQSLGLFLLWPLCIYFLFGQETKKNMTRLSAALVVVSLINVFVFSGNYGFLSAMFQFDESIPPAAASGFINLLIVILAFTAVLLFSLRFRKITVFFMATSVCALVLTGIINFRQIQTEFKYIQSQKKKKKVTDDSVYKFSKTGRNVVVIMLDRAIAGFIPHIFQEKPELENSFDGFTWYNNTISFGESTPYGMPPLFGGYEYAPLESIARSDKTLTEKHNEAILLLPLLFLNHGFSVTVTDPTFANYKTPPDLSIFEDYPQIRAENIDGKYNRQWLDKNTYFENPSRSIEGYLIRFSFFRFTPTLLRNFVYDGGKWLMVKKANAQEDDTYLMLSRYIALDVLPDITEISETEFNHYNAIINALPHDSAYLRAPDYFPANVTNTERSLSSGETIYHVNIASFILLGKWLDFLKEQNVYDNTRIIVASDHGRNITSRFLDNLVLPNKKALASYTPLLLVKDFNAHGAMSVDSTFMTQADVPLIALDGIVENPVNPWTGNILKSDKENGATITTTRSLIGRPNERTALPIRRDEWIHVHTNIFDMKNWTNVTVE
jgi:hypothetical protein